MAHADDVQYEGPICDMCRITMFVGTCSHRPRKFPPMPTFNLSEEDKARIKKILDESSEGK